jgi:predicted kinase
MSYDVVLISGIPGAGKTTVSKMLAAKLPKAAHISLDQVRKMIVGGYKSPTIMPWDDETKKQYYLSFKNAFVLTENFIAAGYRVIVDDTMHAGDLYQEWNKYFSKFHVLKILLYPSPENALRRNRERSSHFVDEKVLLEVYKNFQKYDYSDWLVIDNGDQTVEETVTAIQTKIHWL